MNENRNLSKCKETAWVWIWRISTDQYQCFHDSPNYWRGEADVQQALEISLRNNLLLEKQSGFLVSNSTEHALIQLIRQILHGFNENKYILRIFIDLRNSIQDLFDTVDHDITFKIRYVWKQRKKLKMISQVFNKQKIFCKI